MININQVILSGNLVDDAELRYTKKGTPVLSFRMATNKYVNDQQYTQFHRVVCWIDAEEFAPLLKGDFVSVVGELQTHKYKDSKGMDRFITQVVAINLTLGLKKQQSNFENFSDEEVPF